MINLNFYHFWLSRKRLVESVLAARIEEKVKQQKCTKAFVCFTRA